VTAEPGPFLPYRCDKLRSESLQRPCEKNLAQVKAKREKFPDARVGPLEHCLACRGRDLITREAPVPHFEGKTELLKGSRQDLVAPPLQDNSQDFDKVSPLDPKEPPIEEPLKEEREMAGVVFKDIAEAERVLGAGKLTGIAEETIPRPIDPSIDRPTSLPAPPVKGQFCKNHPEAEAHKNKHGGYLGRCRACMATQAAANSRNRGGKAAKGKMTAAVARDLAKKQERAPMPPAEPADSHGSVRPLYSEQYFPVCKNHPTVSAKIDSLGRSMGLCAECLTARGRAFGTKNTAMGLTSPPVAIPLNQAQYAEIRQWLKEQAAENKRTLLQEIMYRLKLAMREATGCG
jgi:hypothetical protein